MVHASRLILPRRESRHSIPINRSPFKRAAQSGKGLGFVLSSL
ncbi:hypothetical protein MGWOODY_Clf1800 [hydrothermal vent metagenome]|uniref:Uncharacterized protein n=1 Tax=hydrothermal vent metagenome TaxID=652676 RepID=A0A160VBL9_9ZZZZ